ncbi:hypothetical protein Scep_004151 [Stephania cephalantha]|uniref:Uncharacterized protein n=1 Tax=Stephania cephalantha TaxID=152367 RepID=A0AAP0KTQ0_9MAGN
MGSYLSMHHRSHFHLYDIKDWVTPLIKFFNRFRDQLYTYMYLNLNFVLYVL